MASQALSLIAAVGGAFLLSFVLYAVLNLVVLGIYSLVSRKRIVSRFFSKILRTSAVAALLNVASIFIFAAGVIAQLQSAPSGAGGLGIVFVLPILILLFSIIPTVLWFFVSLIYLIISIRRHHH